MARWGMAIDLDKCSGCQACTVACATENNAPLGSLREAEMGRIIRWIQMLPEVKGEYPDVSAELMPMMCQQCTNAPCTNVCPVAATYRGPDGVVAQIYWRCIGCRYCVNACPYTIKWFNWWTPVWPGEMASATNPNVDLEGRTGVTEKCCFCHHRLMAVKDGARREGRAWGAEDYRTACQEACPTEAIAFGDLDDPTSEVAEAHRSPRSMHLLEELGTEPKVTYLRAR